MWIADAARSREIDRRATEEYGVPARVLMERAGMAVFDAVREFLPEGGRLAVLCGKGNNGGDGFVVARLGHEHGYVVDCLIAAEAEDTLSEAAQEQYRIARAQGVQPLFVGDAKYARKLECLGCKDLLVDALLGTGARHLVSGPLVEAIAAINRSGVPVIAVDVPSGISCDTGEELGQSVWALKTITFGLPKRFLFQGIGIEHAGCWSVADIGFPSALLKEPTEAQLIDRNWVVNLLPERLRGSHKGDNGSVLIVAGSHRMRGAAVLCALGALGVGAGLVTVAGIDEVCDAVAAQVPEAMLLPLPSRAGAVSPEAAEAIVEVASRADAVAFGPGMSQAGEVRELLDSVWPQMRRPCVIDADALNAASMGLALPNVPCVLTPHPGEMSRLLNSSTAEVQSDRFRATAQAVDETRKCVLLKGAYTVICAVGQPMLVNPTGNPGMATGGMGDVLTGIVAALLAQGLPEHVAAACSAYWHGYAANLCAEQIGPLGYKASELARLLPLARAQMVQA